MEPEMCKAALGLAAVLLAASPAGAGGWQYDPATDVIYHGSVPVARWYNERPAMETGARRYHSPRHYRLRHVPRCPHRLCGYPLPIYKAHRPIPPLQGLTAHADWCAARYRSYDAWTDTYQPYHGPRRYCRSPYR